MTARRPIQIWVPEGQYWVRPPVGPYGDHYSGVREIGPHSSRQRLLLVGESVAAGYLYAPWHTPAIVLGDLLPSWDVVDLARTNESAESLAATVEEAMQLEPDVVAVWAGNNWMLRDLALLSPYHPGSESRLALGQLLERDGLGGVPTFAEAELRHQVWPWLDAIARAVRAAGARLVVVVPEANLIDWPSHQPVPVLPDGTESAWHDALADDDAERMAALDDAATSTTLRGLAEGDGATAPDLRLLRQEVAAAAGPLRAVTTSPMATAAAQDLVREWAAVAGAEVVDVPAVIAAAGEQPDRRWFLDYCHHTAFGIEAICREIGETVESVVARTASVPGPELEAVAALGALMHTDHRLISRHDRRPLLRHWLERARSASAGADELAADIVESRTTPGPVPLTPAQRRNERRPHPFGFAHGWRPYGLEVDALGVLGATSDQLDSLSMPPERAWPPEAAPRPGRALWVDERPGATAHGYLQAIWPVTKFAVGVRPGRTLDLLLTARTRDRGEIVVSLGDWETALPVEASWSTHRFHVPAEAAEPGIGSLEIRWPRLPEGPQRWDAALTALAHDGRPDLHPIFGEVHSLLVDNSTAT